MTRSDPRTHFDELQPRARTWHLRLRVDPERRVLEGEATLVFPGRGVSGLVDLDTRGLAVHRACVTATAAALPFEVGEEEPGLGRRLRLRLPEGTMGVTIAYETAPESPGLRWLEPDPAAGRILPCLATRCAEAGARSLVPCQDSPGSPVIYDAQVTVPEGWAVAMDAEPLGEAPAVPGWRSFRFKRARPLPPARFSLAAGEPAFLPALSQEAVRGGSKFTDPASTPGSAE